MFITGKPEALGNVGAMAREEFHRSDHAKTCSVKSCLLLPVYYPGKRGQCLCIVEVLTNNTDLAYTRMGALFARELAKYGLATCPLSDLEMSAEGAGEISPSLQQGISVSPFIELAPTGRDGRDAAQISLAAASDSARLGMTLADLKSLMQQRRIKTLSRNSMGRYEDEVDLVLNENVAQEGAKRKLPSEAGIDSRWDAARRKPQKQRQKQKHTTRQWTCTSGDFLQAGFPVVREANGKLVADVEMIARRTHAMQIPVTNAKPGGVRGSPSNGLLGHTDCSGSGGVRSGTPSMSAGDSDDWLGMIDPHMLDLMVRDDVIDAVGNMDDIQLF